jgi:hypothetical protein
MSSDKAAEFRARQSVGALRQHHGVAFLDESPIPESRVGTRQAGHSSQFARHSKTRAIKEASRNFPQRSCSIDLPGQLLRKAFLGEAPQIGEFGLITSELLTYRQNH